MVWGEIHKEIFLVKPERERERERERVKLSDLGIDGKLYYSES